MNGGLGKLSGCVSIACHAIPCSWKTAITYLFMKSNMQGFTAVHRWMPVQTKWCPQKARDQVGLGTASMRLTTTPGPQGCARRITEDSRATQQRAISPHSPPKPTIESAGTTRNPHATTANATRWRDYTRERPRLQRRRILSARPSDKKCRYVQFYTLDSVECTCCSVAEVHGNASRRREVKKRSMRTGANRDACRAAHLRDGHQPTPPHQSTCNCSTASQSTHPHL